MAPVHYLETSVLHCGDNLAVLRQMPAECIDLIYLDPPFFSNRNYEVIWADEAEVRSFEDRWEGGIQVYINWMEERVRQLHRVLKPSGTIFLHCDYHAGHYLKVMMDDIFGVRHFQNELIWSYRGGGVPKTAWARKHDTIFFYSKTKDYFFTPQYVPYSESTQQVTGRRGRRVNDTEIDLERGAHMPDWWTDINSLQTWDRERLGYPTQKPEGLLERIYTSVTKPGDVILDPFCGCGTAVAVAQRMGREWIGVDISPTAVRLMEQRVKKNGATEVDVYGVPLTEADLRELKPFEFQNWVIQQVNGTFSPRKSGDMGIDGFSFFYNDPIQVKQSERVGRNVIDNFETAVQRAGHDTGFVIAFSYTRGAYEEAARARAKAGLDIVLITVRDLLTATEALTRPTPADVTGPIDATWLQTQPVEEEPEKRVPDLMHLLSAYRRPANDRPLLKARPKDTRPAISDLVKSDQDN